ncbi:MAG: TolC family protein [Planctomycetota bacterium]
MSGKRTLKIIDFVLTYLIIFSFVSAFASTANSETLAQAVARSFANSDARQAAIKSIEAQNKQVAIAQGSRGFTIDMFGEIALQNVDNSTQTGQPGNNETLTARRVGLSATYPLYDGGELLNQLFQEASRLDAEIIRLSDAAEAIALNAVQAYIDVYRHQNIVTISQQNIDVHAQISQQVGRQVDAGKLSEPDRFQANDKLLAARLAHADAKAALSDALSQYSFVVGTAPRGALSIPDTSKLPGSRSNVETVAVSNSFLLKIAQKDIQDLTYQGAIDLADWQPKLDLFFRGGLEKDVDGEPKSETDVAAGLRLNWTLYKGGTRNKTAARNNDLVIRAHYRKRQVEDEVRNLARQAWNSYTAAVDRKMLLDDTVLNSQNILAAFRREFEAAKRPLLEVLDAERALFNLKVRRANADAAVAFQRYRVLGAQSLLSSHFGLTPYGSPLIPDFETRAKAVPRGDFDITAPPLNQP